MYYFVLVVVLLFLSPGALAQWSTNPNQNNVISAAFGLQKSHQIVSDGLGGAIVTWTDHRSGSPDIYAQRINASGTVMWTPDGVAISTASGDQGRPAIASDGLGGAIITWEDERSGQDDIYAQRVNASGTVEWTVNGVAISTASGDQLSPIVVSDGLGGAIIAWSDRRSGVNDVYAQRVNASGAVEWTVNGVAISTASGEQVARTIVSDGANGAIITMEDFSSGSGDIYAQRINAAGAVQWTVNGVAISTASGTQHMATSVSDGLGGAIIAWSDMRSGEEDIYAQRVNAVGAVQWTVNGVAISTASNTQLFPAIIDDGLGGAIIAWHDARNGLNDIYAQRISSGGAVQWTVNGLAISTASNNQRLPTIAADGSGGAIIAWQDERGGVNDIYAQRINAFGTMVQWIPDGVAISTANGEQDNPKIVGDGSGGAIIVWTDGRHPFPNDDIYAQKIDHNGYLGSAAPTITGVRDVINDQGGRVNVFWNRSYPDIRGTNGIIEYLVFRGARGPDVTTNALVLSREEFNERIIRGETLKDVMWTVNPATTSPATIYWEYYGTVTARQLEHYYIPMNTLADSAIQGIYQTYAMITAVGYGYFGNLYWDSSPDSGYSVDNLPPGPIPSVAPPIVTPGSVVLSWGRPADPDLGGFHVYRGDQSGFVADESSRIATTPDTFFVDTDPGPLSVSSFRRYYRIAAVDIHGNQGQLTPEIAATQASSYAFGVNASWNLVSVPVEVDDYAKTALFPTATSDAFAYSGFYTAHPTLQNGVGYWLKFSASQTITLLGYETEVETIDVAEGWNIVGSLAVPVTVTNIASVPPGIVTEQLYGYGAFGYYVASTIEPGKGYWVKVNQSGKLVLSSVTPDAADRIQIVPTTELPPPPPDGAITGLQSQVPTEFTLEQNYPNPFNPSTSIRFSIPVSGFTTLKLFDALGREVATLVNQHLEAGHYARTLHAGNLGSGVYFYRLTAGTSVETRKMILAK